MRVSLHAIGHAAVGFGCLCAGYVDAQTAHAQFRRAISVLRSVTRRKPTKVLSHWYRLGISPFPQTQLLSFKDLIPRIGATYDLFGNGKTALKVSLNRYVQSLGSQVGSRTVPSTQCQAWRNTSRGRGIPPGRLPPIPTITSRNAISPNCPREWQLWNGVGYELWQHDAQQ